MTEAETIARSNGPATVDSLAADLAALGLGDGEVVIVHSSLSALGWVSGGAVAVVLALERVLGTEGTLVMPTHSGELSDPAGWSNPPVPPSGGRRPRHDACVRPRSDADTRLGSDTGVLPQAAGDGPERPSAGVLRGARPHAEQIVRGHSLANARRASPLARVYELDGQVLLLGVGHASNTSLHLAEYRSGRALQVTKHAPVVVDGERRWVGFDDIDLDESDFEAIGDAFAGEVGLERRRRGRARRGTARSATASRRLCGRMDVSQPHAAQAERGAIEALAQHGPRLSVFVFAALALASFVGLAFVAGYIVGKLLPVASLSPATHLLLNDFFATRTWSLTRAGLIAVGIVFWLAIGFWTFKDAAAGSRSHGSSRSRRCSELCPPYIGALIYMLFRPPEYLDEVRERELEIRAIEERLDSSRSECPVCRSPVEPSYLVCPVCTTRLKDACSRCKAPLEPLWQMCPLCETPVVRRPPMDLVEAFEEPLPLRADSGRAVTPANDEEEADEQVRLRAPWPPSGHSCW